jgi:hypothetical protein
VVVPNEDVSLTGLEATSSLGDPTISISVSPILTGVELTSAVGLLSPADVIGLTGVQSTSAVGVISPTEMTVGLTGQEAVSSVNAEGLILRYYGDLVPKTSTGYTTETPKTSVSGYSAKTPKTSTGYTTKTP